MYQPRDYRKSFTDRLKWYNVCVEETDLMIGTDEDCSELVLKTVRTLRKEIYAAIRDNSEFLTSLVPVEYKGEGVVEAMVEAAKLAEVGPFAAVAGAINDMLAEKLMDKSKQIIIENGGDIYIKSDQDRLIGIYAGNSVLSGKFAIEIQKTFFPSGYVPLPQLWDIPSVWERPMRQ